MESLKSNDENNFLFKCAEISIKNEMKLHKKITHSKKDLDNTDNNEFFMYEFFTGFIPFIIFVIFKEKWCKYYKMDEEILVNYFLKKFSLPRDNRDKPRDFPGLPDVVRDRHGCLRKGSCERLFGFSKRVS